MGFWGQVGSRVREILKFDKERVVHQLAKGETGSSVPGSSLDMLNSYGYDVLADYLKLEQDLMTRFVDAENMDEFPELSCLALDLHVPTPSVPGLSATIAELVTRRESDPGFQLYVYAFDHKEKRVRVVKANGPKKTGTQKVYRVTFEDFRRTKTWSIKATSDHLFMLRDGTYCRTKDLESGRRLMPCTFNADAVGYSRVYEPMLRNSGGSTVNSHLHPLVMEAVLGRKLVGDEMVHHKDRNKANSHVDNLELTNRRDHILEHINNPEEEAKRTAAISASMTKQWQDPKFRIERSKAQRADKLEWFAKEKSGGYQRKAKTGHRLSDEHKAAIGRASRIPLVKDVVEAALRASGSLNEAARKLGVSWNTVFRRINAMGIDLSIIGSNVDIPQPGEKAYDNHRVVSVEYAGEEDVYDIEVPGYQNFAVGDADGSGGYIFVHNSALDIAADDACITADTEIPMLDGSIETVESLYDRGASLEWIYAFDVAQKRVVAGRFERVEVISEKLPVWKVTFQDKKGHIGYIKATANHKFMMLDGEYRTVADLIPGDRLMALFKFQAKQGGRRDFYENVLVQPFSRRWKSTHRMAIESSGVNVPDGYVVHHKNRDSLDNRPENLEVMTPEDHRLEHAMIGADNHKYKPEFKAEMLQELLDSEGFISKKAAGERLGCGYRVVERLARELGADRWSDLKHKLFGLNRRSRGHAPSPNSMNLAVDICNQLTVEISKNPDVSFFAACDLIGVKRGRVECAIQRLGYASWSYFKVAAGGILAPGRHSRCVADATDVNDVVLSVEPAGEERIFDLVNSLPTHNFAAGHDGRWVFIKNTQTESLKNRTVWVDSPDKTVQEILTDLFEHRLRIDEEIWSMARGLAKYGNDYSELLVAQDGLVGLNYLPPPTVRRIEGRRGEVFGFIQDQKGRFGFSIEEFKQILAQRSGASSDGNPQNTLTALEDWEVVHMRNQSKHRRSLYGQSLLEPARWIWKRLMLMEDAAIMYRLQRAPQRYVFTVDVGDLPPKEAFAYLNKVRQQYKKTKFYNAQCLTGDTCVTCLDGVDRSMAELAENYADKEFEVFSYDLESGAVVPGKASQPRKTGEKVPVWRVILDNGSVVRCTADHPFLMRNGEYVAGSMLKPGDSLMPMYLSRGSVGTSGYWMYTDQKTGKRRHVHRMVAESSFGKDACNGMHVHHRDGDKQNNTTENLALLTASEHMLEHPDHAAKGRAAFVDRVNKDSEFRKSCAERLGSSLASWRAENPELAHRLASEHSKKLSTERKKALSGSYQALLEIMSVEVVRDPLVVVDDLVNRLNDDQTFRSIYGELMTTSSDRITAGCLHAFLKRNGFSGFKDFKKQKTGIVRWKNRTYGSEPTRERRDPNYNHKVLSVTQVGYEDVYNFEVEKYHNFALTNGVFVHNSGKLDLKFNPLSQDEDFFITSRKGVQTSKVDVLSAPVWSSMEDIEYFRLKMFAAIKVPKTYLGFAETTAKGVLCLSGDTMVPLLDGKSVSMRDLAAKPAGEKFHVYACDKNGKVVPGEATHCRVTRPNAEVWEVELDDGTKIKGTNDHPFMMRDGSYKDLGKLEPGDSLMPLYRKLSAGKGRAEKLNGYEMVQHPSDGSFQYTHHMVSENSDADSRHYDSDVSISRLVSVSSDYRCRSIKELCRRSGYSNSLVERLLRDAGLTREQFKQRYLTPAIVPAASELPNNHKVVAVRFVGREDCYDLTVKDHHNFAAGDGEGGYVFVHNSAEDVRFARTVLRLQRQLRNGLRKMARVHLAALNINPAAVEFEIYMTVPSSIFELAQLEVRNAKADFAGRMSQFVSLHWILQKVFGLSDDEIEFIIKQRHEEQLQDAEVQAKAMGMAQPPAPGSPAAGQPQVQAVQAAGQAMTADPNTAQSEEAMKKLREVGSLSRMWASKRQDLGYRPISERELFAGNREHEKRMEEDLGKVLRNDRDFAKRLGELGELIRELRMTRDAGSGFR